MATIAEQIDRIARSVQDEDHAAYSRVNVLTQQQHEIARLARERRTGDILIMQGVADQALYTLPDAFVQVEQVVYNGRRLDYASEEMLDRKYQGLWEVASATDPKYWTTSNQAPKVVRLVPPPRRTGSVVPVLPPAPFSTSLTDNLVILYFRDFSGEADTETDAFPLLDCWEDVVSWRTAAELTRREGPYQNLPLSAVCSTMAELWLKLLES